MIDKVGVDDDDGEESLGLPFCGEERFELELAVFDHGRHDSGRPNATSIYPL